MGPHDSKYTPTGLGRWSATQAQLPNIDRISEINVFDFDNTLFRTPMPNPQLWDARSAGLLASEDSFTDGGWWHNPSILSSIDGGVDVQEAKAWEGYWDEAVVAEVRLSTQSPTALTVLMTGRGQARFSDLITRIVRSKRLNFDLIVLKPTVGPDGTVYRTTLDFKSAFLEHSLLTYKYATELNIFEDRPKQAQGFERYLAALNAEWEDAIAEGRPKRAPVIVKVLLVEQRLTYLDVDTELSAIFRIMDAHNLAVKMGRAKRHARLWNMVKSRVYTGYLLQSSATERLINLLKASKIELPKDCRVMGDSIMISFRPPREDVISRAGGWGAHRKWRVNGLGSLGGNVWAARLSPVDPNLSTYTESFTPLVVLAMRKYTKATEANRISNWVNIPEGDARAITFDTVVQDKISVKLVEASSDGYYDFDGRVITVDGLRNHALPAHPRGNVVQNYGEDNAAEQSSADEYDLDKDFPSLAKANHQVRGLSKRRNDRRDPKGPRRGQQQGQNQNRGQQRDSNQGPQYGYGGKGRQGPGGGGGGRMGNRRNRGGGGGVGQYRSLDDAGGAHAGASGAVGMQY